MNYSRSHLWFAWRLSFYHNFNKQDVLENPEKYLGPNYKEVLNYWFYRGSWSEEQRLVYRDVYSERIEKLDYNSRKISEELCKEVIDHKLCELCSPIEKEIIAAHLYIERRIPFTFMPVIMDLDKLN